MNIIIPHSWLMEFVKTKAAPAEIAEKLSLSSFSVERLKRTGDGDVLYEIEVTGNRPDALSVIGIAREVGAVLPQFGIEAEFVDNFKDLNIKSPETPLELKVQIEDPTLCPRFTALILKEIGIKPSPVKIQERLQKVGIRSLNNAIDITNYLMIERGQPMHVFDYDKISGATMILRESRQGESIVTLDGQERKLPPGTIVIEDKEKLIDLCGIMGGDNSKVDENTKRVVLFVQIYDPQKIRKTTQELGFRTEASSRFEKGMDPLGVLPALKEAARFLIEEAGGVIASPLIDITNEKYTEHEVVVTTEEIESLLGIAIEPERVARNLRLLGFEPRWTTAPNEITTAPELKIIVPSWRAQDVKIAADVVEEIARLYGYHNLPQALPPLPSKLPREETIFVWERKARQVLKGLGFNEIYTSSFTDVQMLTNAGFDPHAALQVKNPLTQEMTHLRTSLLPQLLKTLNKNQVRFEEQKLFELNRIFRKVKDSKLPEETQRLAGVLYRADQEAQRNAELFFVAKGMLETLLRELGIDKVTFTPQEGESAPWQRGRTAWLEIPQSRGAMTLGSLGEVQPGILSAFSITGSVVGFDLDFETLSQLAKRGHPYQPLPEHPPVVEDLTFEIKRRYPAAAIVNEIGRLFPSGEEVTVETEIKDTYEDEELHSAHKRALTLTIRYWKKEGNLSDAEVRPLREKIIKKVKEAFEAELRGVPSPS